MNPAIPKLIRRQCLLFCLGSMLAWAGHVRAETLPGEAKALPCTACHGQYGEKSAPGMPAIGGRAPDQILAALDDFRAGRRMQPYMQILLATMTRQDLEEIAEYFAVMGAGETGKPLY